MRIGAGARRGSGGTVSADNGFCGGKENATAVAKAFCDTIAEAGYEPMIYSQLSYLQTGFDWEQLSGYRVWVAAHRDSMPKLDVPVDLWQYTRNGSVQGANTDQGVCDMNYSYMVATRVRFTQTTLTMKRGETAQADRKTHGKGEGYSDDHCPDRQWTDRKAEGCCKIKICKNKNIHRTGIVLWIFCFYYYIYISIIMCDASEEAAVTLFTCRLSVP